MVGLKLKYIVRGKVTATYCRRKGEVKLGVTKRRHLTEGEAHKLGEWLYRQHGWKTCDKCGVEYAS